ncbi:hypothetical protein [Embleya sp. NPDC005575]|uniref:hypothetical protein n=1 Tax=Embleya sp. NPDC005575 TaxID=3156892 RepID=UPI0033A9117E
MARTPDPASLSSHEVHSAVRHAVQWVVSRLPSQQPETVAEDAEYAAWMLSAAVEHHRESAISAVAEAAASHVYAPAAAVADALGLTAPAIVAMSSPACGRRSITTTPRRPRSPA